MRPSLRLLGIMLGLSAAWTAEAQASSPHPGRTLALSPCRLTSPGGGAQVEARCGAFEVAEDPSLPDGRRLRLRVAVVATERPAAGATPLFLLAGGPGQSALEAFPAVLAAFGRVGRTRDLVLVEARGSGGPSRLSCPALEDRAAVDRTEAQDLALLDACAAALSGRADLTRYGTDALVQDLDLVRAALGYPRIDLYGASYGTRAAQVYARTFPDRVRAMILDGVVPMEMAIGEAIGADGQRALDLLLARCRDDAACQARRPALDEALAGLLARLERAPARVRLREPRSGAPLELEVRAEVVADAVLGALYAPETVSLLPALIRAGADGDLAPLVALAIIGGGDLAEGLSRPLHLSVLCGEDEPYYSAPPAAVAAGPAAAAPAAARASGIFGTRLAERYRRACARWPRTAVPPAFHAPLRADLPVLLLSGEADPVTPPDRAAQVARGLSRARALVVPGAAHGAFSRGCVPRLMAEFLEAGGAEPLDVACLDRSSPPPLFLDLSGPKP